MRIITVSSFKGGTAKTSVSLNIGAVLAKKYKKKVLLIDFDAQANLTAGLGFDPDEHDSLAEVLLEKKKIEDVTLKTKIKNLDLIPADTWLERVEVSGDLASDRYSHERLKKVLKPLKYDYVLIDTPPSLCWLTESAFIASDHCLVAATPEFYSVKGMQRLSLFMSNISKRHPLNVLGVVLSFWNNRGKNNNSFLSVINDTFPGKVLSYKIRKDVSVSEASILGKPVIETAPTSRASEDYVHVTKELLKKM
ncbi:MAG: Sporulation initiation inhibitor protein Soj [Chlamydiia bacterium]|nr:Sporulation initiation inhibitor protein Soj [Chlamydiia bacterium]